MNADISLFGWDQPMRPWKCGLVKATGGPGTDIRLKWAACSRWEAKP